MSADAEDVCLSRRVSWLCRLMGAGGLALLGVTWTLWTPQEVFPRVPLLAWAPPRWWDWASLLVLVGGLAGLCLAARHRRVFAAGVVSGFAIQFLADQHRMQPWAWQFFILALVIGLADDRTIFRGWWLLVISIYVWSGWSKVDEAFQTEFASIVERMLWTPWEFTGWKWSPSGRVWLHRLAEILAMLPPVAEGSIAVLALFVRTRRWAFWLSALMHFYLIMLLGPWGLGHQPGVLLWNLFFIAQNALLFGDRTTQLSRRLFEQPFTGPLARPRRWVCESILAFVMLWPAVEPWGACDPWLGWAVYVPRFHRAGIRIHDDALAGPLIELSKFTEGAGPWKAYSDFPSTSRLDLGRMSLQLLNAPASPNVRCTVGAALDWQSRVDVPAVEVRLFHRRNRFEADFGYDRTLSTFAEIEAHARSFRVNALPESVLRQRAAE
jgi:hypothetical protein